VGQRREIWNDGNGDQAFRDFVCEHKMSGADLLLLVQPNGIARCFEMRSGEAVISPLIGSGVIRPDRIFSKQDFGFQLRQN
jgi:hypothetical protein